MSTALAKADGKVGRALIVADALTQESEQRELLGQYVARHMTAGVDYGVIPGTERKDRDGNDVSPKALLKPGAEKLTQLFRCVPRFVLEEKVENWDTGLFFYRFACRIVNQDEQVVAEGVGSCSTYESRYRWRSAKRTCPNCGKDAIIRQKEEKGGNWLCVGNDKGGCWAKFDKADPAITSQEVGRVPNPDLIDQANTVLKMAKKRAHVDAAIALARCSDIFTQDIEDQEADSAGRPQPAPAKPAPPPAAPSAEQFKFLMTRIGWTWANVWTALDRKNGTTHKQDQTPYEKIDPAQVARLAAWMEKQPAKLTETVPPDRGDAWEPEGD